MTKRKGVYWVSLLACASLLVGGAFVKGQFSDVQASNNTSSTSSNNSTTNTTTNTSSTSGSTSTTDTSTTGTTDSSGTETEADFYNQGLTVRALSTVRVGDEGKLAIDFTLEDVTFAGTYTFAYDSTMVEIDKDGNWKALKSGDIKVVVGYEPSAEMLKELNTKYNNQIPTQTDTNSTVTMKSVAAEDVFYNDMTVTNSDSVVRLDGKGTLDITTPSYEGVTFDGDYFFSYDPSLISIDAEGKWETFAEGDVKVTYGYIPSEKMLAELNTHFKDEIPEQKASTPLELSIVHVFTTGMEISTPVNVEVGQTGKFNPTFSFGTEAEPAEIEFDGTYYFGEYDKTALKVEADGTWTALKKGSYQVTYGYVPSEKMLTALNEYYKDELPVQTAKSLLMNISIDDSDVYSTGLKVLGDVAEVVEVGDTGKLDLTFDYNGVTFNGEYFFAYDTSKIKIATDGTWTALEAGSVSISYGYVPSEEMLEALKAVTDTTARATETAITPSQLSYSFLVLDKLVLGDTYWKTGMTLTAPDLIKVGDTGNFEMAVNYGNGIEFDGTYVLNYDTDYLNVDATGKFSALKAGTVNVYYGYRPSEKMLSAINKYYLGEVPLETTDLVYKQIVIADATGKTVDSSSSDATGKLPQTGETSQNMFMVALGFILALLALVIWKREKIFKTK